MKKIIGLLATFLMSGVLLFAAPQRVTDSKKTGEIVTEQTTAYALTVVRTNAKPAVVIAAETYYIAFYKQFYGEEDTSYTNASWPVVAYYVSSKATNSALRADAQWMDANFRVIEAWWLGVKMNADTFHPYCWGETNDIVVQGHTWINQ